MRGPLFVASAYRSGSTLVGLVLGSHSQAFDVGEFGSLPTALHASPCNCGADPLATCPVWKDALDEVNRRLDWDAAADPTGRPLCLVGRTPLQRVRMRTIRRLYSRGGPGASLALALLGGSAICKHLGPTTLAFYEAILDVVGSQVIVDCDKDTARLKALLSTPPAEYRIVHLVRDGRGVVASHLSSEGTTWAHRAEDAARAWLGQNAAIQRIVDELPESFCIRVRYEDFCRSPDETTARICAFAGLPFEPEMLRFWEPTHHTVAGNRMRMRGDGSIRLNESWREQLTDGDLEAFERLAGNTNRAYGYTE